MVAPTAAAVYQQKRTSAAAAKSVHVKGAFVTHLGSAFAAFSFDTDLRLSLNSGGTFVVSTGRRRHEYRYWDGTTWSSQVSDRGLTSTDPQLRPPTSPAVGPTVGPLAGPGPALAAPAGPGSAVPQSTMPMPTLPTMPMPPGPQGQSPEQVAMPTPTPTAARTGRGRWAVPLVAIFAMLAGLVIWTPWASKVPASSVVYQQMRNSAAAAKSVHIKGAFIEKGQKLQIDVAGDRAGTNTRVIVDDGNGAVEILTVNGRFYLKADAAYWTKNGSAAAKVAAGKYVTVPAGSAAGMDVFKVGTLLDQILAKDMSNVQKLNTQVEETEVDGVSAYLMTDKIGGDGSRIYVSADGQARLIRIESPKGEGSLNFTEWDAVAPVSAPPADQLVELPRF